MGLMSNDLARLSPAAQKQVMEKMRKPGKYKAQKPGESWITCSKCGTSYKPPVWQAAGGGVKDNG